MIIHVVYTNTRDRLILSQVRALYYKHIYKTLEADDIMFLCDATYFKSAEIAHEFYLQCVTHRSIKAEKNIITINNENNEYNDSPLSV